jgi:hypothetical protein
VGIIIVVEGPDGGGKTTLVNQLAEHLQLPIAPRVVSKDTQALVDLKAWTEENVSQGFQEVIYDRHRLISEPIYGSILRADFEPGFDDLAWYYSMWRQFILEVNPIIIYCVPPWETVKANLADDEDNVVVKPSARSIYSLYLTFAAQHAGWGALVYDYTSMTFDQAMLDVVDELNERKRSN